jgi:hypothetical protein
VANGCFWRTWICKLDATVIIHRNIPRLPLVGPQGPDDRPRTCTCANRHQCKDLPAMHELHLYFDVHGVSVLHVDSYTSTLASTVLSHPVPQFTKKLSCTALWSLSLTRASPSARRSFSACKCLHTCHKSFAASAAQRAVASASRRVSRKLVR